MGRDMIGQIGLSPPVRGSQERREGQTGTRRSIPARAGEPSSRVCSRRRTAVYPRPCGGAAGPAGAQQVAQGLSPPVRGSRVLPRSPGS